MENKERTEVEAREANLTEDKNINEKIGGKWEFNDAVTDVFDEMLRRSIPQYEVMRKSVLKVGNSFIKKNTRVLDLGCSRGESIDALVTAHPQNEFYGIEISKPMVNAAKMKFRYDGNVKIIEQDLREFFPDIKNVSVVLAILTLQFIPIEYRHKIVQQVYDSLNPGGAFIFVEKVLGNTDQINQMMVEHYYTFKGNSGYTQEEIERKRLSLEGVLVPITSDWNVELLKNTGFKQVDVFWRWMNFVGYVAIK